MGAGTYAERITALVVEAESPIDNLVKLGKAARSTVRILVGEGEDRIYTAGSLLIQQYRMAGIEIDEQGNVLE